MNELEKKIKEGLKHFRCANCNNELAIVFGGLFGDKSELNLEEKQRFKAKELSYSVCGDIRYNDPNLSCDRCKSIRVAQLIYGDVFMRMCNGNKKQKCQEI